MKRAVTIVAMVSMLGGLVVTAGAAHACSPGLAAPDSALPPAGAGDVSPQTSIVFMTHAQEVPAGLELLVAGVSGPLPAIRPLGAGLAAAGSATFWLLDAALQPSTDYVLRVADSTGPRELTHFSTAATYDKTPDTPPEISGLRLWRVHYPVAEIGAGGCVFSEFEGYFALDFVPATVPGTPEEETVSVLSLAPKNGGTPLQLVFSGLTSLPGGLVSGTSMGDGVPLPGDEHLSPSAALWKPELQPDREYCAAISTFGRNDRAALPVSSKVVCAPVTSIDARTTGGAAGGSGCAVGGRPAPGPAGPLLLVVAGLALGRARARARSSGRRSPE